ncbi:hypothetical protein KC19_N032000 [Ceratodon purpureus]|nr:hypothetical protein KC19_N032000 [Ceratodon purpureus]
MKHTRTSISEAPPTNRQIAESHTPLPFAEHPRRKCCHRPAMDMQWPGNRECQRCLPCLDHPRPDQHQFPAQLNCRVAFSVSVEGFQSDKGSQSPSQVPSLPMFASKFQPNSNNVTLNPS